jgi:hypothetical protein
LAVVRGTHYTFVQSHRRVIRHNNILPQPRADFHTPTETLQVLNRGCKAAHISLHRRDPICQFEPSRLQIAQLVW